MCIVNTELVFRVLRCSRVQTGRDECVHRSCNSDSVACPGLRTLHWWQLNAYNAIYVAVFSAFTSTEGFHMKSVSLFCLMLSHVQTVRINLSEEMIDLNRNINILFSHCMQSSILNLYVLFKVLLQLYIVRRTSIVYLLFYAVIKLVKF